MRVRRSHLAPADRALARVSAAVILAGATTLAFATAPALSSPSRPTVAPRHGKPFVPVLGDWEGTIDGFPASFGLAFDARLGSSRVPPYGLQSVVTLRPDACPASSYHYAEEVIGATRLIRLRRYGTFGLSSLGFAGSLTGANSATLQTSYQAGSGSDLCRGTLKWRMHPSVRRAVRDGIWQINFRDGERERFRVEAGGRVTTSIAIPSELTRCSGVSGDVALFIGPSGLATVTRPGLQMAIRFSGASASGELNSRSGGCAGGPFRFSAKLG